MKETGIEFDMNPDTFTLENLFAMELSRFNETIQTIVTSASKELQIEKASVFFAFLFLGEFHRYK
jgi:dynein heavy chain